MARSGDGPPRYVPNAIADRIVGLTAIGAICSALLHRERTGQGQRVDVPMFETMVRFTLGDHLGGLTFEPPLDDGGYPRLLTPERRPYRTRDGYICALLYNDKQWRTSPSPPCTTCLRSSRTRIWPLLASSSARTIRARGNCAAPGRRPAGRMHRRAPPVRRLDTANIARPSCGKLGSARRRSAPFFRMAR